MKRSLKKFNFKLKWWLFSLVILTVCTGIPQMALAQWGYGGSSYYSDYSAYYYGGGSYYSGGDCSCGGNDSGWLSYIPYLGSCNRIEIDD